MNKFICTLYISIFLLDYLSNNLHLISRYFSWFPEILSMVALLIIPARFMIIGGKNFPPKSVFFIIFLVFNILLGVVINLEPPAPLIAGLRAYLKALPFFILPFVYDFSIEQISRQLKLLLYLLLMQNPIALYQRLVQSRGLLTGDLVTGTLTGSGHLTIVLCCGIAVLMTFYLAKMIDLRTFAVLFIIFFIPMTINETKVTVVLLPVALMTPVMSLSAKISVKQYIPMFLIGVFAGVAFIAIYDYFITERWGYGLIEFFTREGRAEGYLYKGADTRGNGEVGRVDTYVLAFKALSENVLHLFFGLGIGNVSESFIGGLSGEYAKKYENLNVNGTGLGLVLWEMGIFGAVLYYTFYYMVYKDGKLLSQRGGMLGTFAAGWSVVAVLMMFSTGYLNVIQDNAIAYPFWFYSGYILAECYKYKRMQPRSY